MKMKVSKKALGKQFKISIVPILIALAYAAFTYYNTTELKRSVTIFINNFGASFFFIMWIVGQYLRAEKEVNDSSNFESLRAGIDDVMNSIENLKNYQIGTSRTVASNNLILGAREAVENGFVLAGLMQAGVAFEQAIFAKAEASNLERETTSKTIYKLRQIYDQGIINELFAIWKLRNQLVHLTPEAAQELENRPELLKYFEWGVSILEK